MKKLVLVATAVALLALTQSCFDPYNGGGMCIGGVGSIVEEEIQLDSFNSVVCETVVDVEIIQGTEQKVVVEGHENMIEELDLKVFNGKLNIDLRNNCYNHFDLKVFITVPNLELVKVESTGDVSLGEFKNLENLELSSTSTGDIVSTGLIEVKGLTVLTTKSTGNIELELTTTELEANITSTGNIDLEGSCIKQSIELDGTGNFRAYDFESEECDIDSDGIGDAKVFVTKELQANINSVGNVYVKGDPKIYSTENSVGDLVEVN